MISLRLNEKTEQLRSEFSAWLKNNPPPEIVGPLELDEFVEMSTAWQKALAKEHWIAVHWPERYGGRGMSLVDEAVIQECLAEVRAPQLVDLFGLYVVAPLLLCAGTPEQCSRFLPRIRTADELWCQGFEQSETGTAVVSLGGNAQWCREGWKVTGEKSGVSRAQYAHWCLCLMRTEAELVDEEGLSCIAVPLNAPGVVIEPVRQLSGDWEHSKVKFDRVLAGPESMIGARGRGWEIAMRALGYRRLLVTLANHLESETVLAEIGEMLGGRKDGQTELERYGRLAAEHMALRTLMLDHLHDAVAQRPGGECVLDQLAWSETYQEICRFALELGGLSGLIEQDKPAATRGLLRRRYLCSRSTALERGSLEHQRSIIAKELLGQPAGRGLHE